MQQAPTADTVNGPVAHTEARKVIIKGLPHETSEALLVRPIVQLLSPLSPSQPRHPPMLQTSKMKGHAFLVLESHRFAKEVVDAIDGQKLQGWELRAMPTKEGFEPAENFYSEQRGYLMPDSSGRKSKSGMQHLSDYEVGDGI
ncbi:hypothetical protein F5882DRAFT_383867 [Hyaloscypha sp. PMI_1271]|nr:hypothetical protein F5882DRAFT_383867 [Hyaloscypha sp. PMI_1271]